MTTFIRNSLVLVNQSTKLIIYSYLASEEKVWRHPFQFSQKEMKEYLLIITKSLLSLNSKSDIWHLLIQFYIRLKNIFCLQVNVLSVPIGSSWWCFHNHLISKLWLWTVSKWPHQLCYVMRHCFQYKLISKAFCQFFFISSPLPCSLVIL